MIQPYVFARKVCVSHI